MAAIEDALKPSDAPRWSLVYALLRLIGRLLGYDYVRGARCHSPTYWQTSGQHFNTVVFEGGDIMQDYYDQKNAIAIRRQVVAFLRSEGHSDYVIAEVLNTSEYQIKKLRHDDPRPESGHAV